ncbi:Uncharacterised protein [Segatella copri]|nr:Uncharacterised protein [Segatella copri]
MEIGCQEEMKPKHICQARTATHTLVHQHACQECYYIHYQQILCYNWNIAHNFISINSLII